MAYVKQGPWTQGSSLDAGQLNMMDDGIYAASLGAGVGSNLIGDPHFADANAQTTMWTPDAGWTFASGVWTGTDPGFAGSVLEYTTPLPVVQDQVYRVRVEINLSGNSTTGTVSVVIDWRDAAGALVSTATPVTMTNGNVPATFYQGWAVVPAGVVAGRFKILVGNTVPAADSVRVTQVEVVTIPRPVVVILGTADPVPSTLPSGSLIVRS